MSGERSDADSSDDIFFALMDAHPDCQGWIVNVDGGSRYYVWDPAKKGPFLVPPDAVGPQVLGVQGVKCNFPLVAIPSPGRS
jgi:hypothetical protein